MVIVSQNGERALFKFDHIDVAKRAPFTIYAEIQGADTGYVVGIYPSLARCKEVIQQIVNAYNEGVSVFEMPKE